MVTNYPQSIAANQVAHGAHDDHFTVLDRLRQMMCGLHGHDNLVQFEHDRMFLRCVSCGHETRGWELNDTRPPRVTVHEPQRAPMARPQLITERKIA